MERSYLEENLISGVYTHRDTYLKQFTENWNDYYSLPLIYNVHKGKINENMERLRQDFIASKKRFWLFMDEDILFTRNDVIETALDYMLKNDLNMVGVYEITDQNLAKTLNPDCLKFTHLTWLPGYFMLVDSQKSGLTPFDLNLPTSHGSLSDIAYSMDIITKDNGLIGIAPSFVYHADKGYSPKVKNPFKLTKDNEKTVNKKVMNFLKSLDKNLYFGNPKIEIVFLDNGDIDVNETIGHHYLKSKHPDIYYKVVARPSYYNLKEVKKIKKFTNNL